MSKSKNRSKSKSKSEVKEELITICVAIDQDERLLYAWYEQLNETDIEQFAADLRKAVREIGAVKRDKA